MEWLFLIGIVLGFIVFTVLLESTLIALISRIVAACRLRSSKRKPGRQSNAANSIRPVNSPRAYAHALRLALVLALLGFLLSVVGGMTDQQLLLVIGASLFLSGAALWALTWGAQFVRGFICAVRKVGWRSLAQNPWSLLLYVFLTLFFLWLGTQFVLFILRPLR